MYKMFLSTRVNRVLSQKAYDFLLGVAEIRPNYRTIVRDCDIEVDYITVRIKYPEYLSISDRIIQFPIRFLSMPDDDNTMAAWDSFNSKYLRRIENDDMNI